jgi:DNA polymerase-3 subunit alpha
MPLRYFRSSFLQNHMADFVHLHNHSHFSLLDAAATPESLILAAKADGQTALALTDHGVMFGCFEFYKKAKKHDVKPIVGCEVYVAVNSRFDRDRVADMSGKKRNYYHLVLLTKNETGYRNLLKLTSIAHTEGFYYKPRIDFDLLREHHEGLIATSACLAGPINAPMLAGDSETAYANARLLKDIFGDDFYIELQDHGLPQDKHVLEFAPKLAKELGIKLVVTNDVHYVDPAHAVPHNVLLSINKDTSASRNESFDVTKDLRYGTERYYLASQAEMKRLFKEFPEGIESTLEIADKVNLKIPTELQLPQFPIPPESGCETLDDYLEQLTMRGLEDRYPILTSEILDRAAFELKVIRTMGYAGYFLIVQDFIQAARNRGIRVGPGRGSAAGSLVAFAVGITNIDPLKYDLLFERFLNPDRVSMPDIDVDFSDDKREEVISYVRDKYGAEAVAQIITFGTLSSRAVLKDVGRVLGVELSVINSITDKIPVVQGKVHKLKDALELPELRHLKDSTDPKLRKLIEYSLVLEGFNRNSSLHAAGVVIAPGPISNFVPLYKTPQTDVATQYNMKDLEEAGLLKMDFLGLRTLSIIDNTLEQIRRNHNVVIDIDAVPLTDTKVYEMLGKGQTLAVFQFESEPMQNAMRQLKPSNLEDLIAMNALYRPGPMDNIPDFIARKQGRKPIDYMHPAMQPILERTYGIIVYQEQVMQLVQALAGFTLAQSDLMRRAMGKKDLALMAEQEALFVDGALATQNMPKELAKEIFSLIRKFAQYGFNKSHSAAYAYVAYQTAWLKAHYPAEFLAANMTAELNDQAKIVALSEEAGRFGIKVVPPDINKSMATFQAREGVIYFGMAGIRNVGVGVVESIITTRSTNPIQSVYDLTSRVDPRQINRRVLEALICAGAFDSLKKGHRAQLFEAIETALEFGKSVQTDSLTSQDSLFADTATLKPTEPGLPQIPEWPERDRLKREKEFLNFYISGHPLREHAVAVRSLSNLNLQRPDPSQNGNPARICGLVGDMRTKLDKRERTFCVFKLEQFVGSCEVVLWADAYAGLTEVVKPGAVVTVTGKAEINGDVVKLIGEEVVLIDNAVRKFVSGYAVRLTPDVDESDLHRLRSHCSSADAHQSLTFIVQRPSGTSVTYASSVRIMVTPETTEFLQTTFGEQNVRYAT